MAVTPRWNRRVVFGAKDLKPMSSRDWRYMEKGWWLGVYQRRLYLPKGTTKNTTDRGYLVYEPQDVVVSGHFLTKGPV
jgi:hypothetical protein